MMISGTRKKVNNRVKYPNETVKIVYGLKLVRDISFFHENHSAVLPGIES